MSRPGGAIIDEAQRVPSLFNYLQQELDESHEKGNFILTGSNNFLLMENITQSLAGRIGYLELLPFNFTEIKKIPEYDISLNTIIVKGGYPSITYEKIDPQLWFPSFIRTYIERDVRQLKNIHDLAIFQRLLYLCAGRTGQQLNLSNLAIECGLDYKTVQSWIGIMQASYIIHLLQPFYNNFSKRIIKAPKLYFYDTGLVCSLLGIQSPEQLNLHPMKGALFENFIINELIKKRFNKGLRHNLFYWRDVSGHEIDVIIDNGLNLTAVEIKAGMTVMPEFFKGLTFWKSLTGNKNNYLIYAGEYQQDSDDMTIINWKNVEGL